MDFLENKRIFAKGVRDLGIYLSEMPLGSAHVLPNDNVQPPSKDFNTFFL